MRQKPPPSVGRKPHKVKQQKDAQSNQQKHPFSPQPTIATWPVQSFDPDFLQLLEKDHQESVAALSDTGRKALTILLKTALVEGQKALWCSPRRHPNNVREQLKGLRTRTLAALATVARYPHLNGSLLEKGLMEYSAFLTDASSPRPNPPPAGFHRVSTREYRDRFAWPFFPPALWYAIERIYELECTRKIEKQEIYDWIHKLLPKRVQSARAASERVRRFKRSSPGRASKVETLVSMLLSTPVHK